MRNKRSTPIFIAALCAIAVTAAGDTPAKSRDYSAVPPPLANFSYGGVAREQYIAGIFGVFRQLDKNADGLTTAEIDAVDEVERARRSAMALTMIYVYDLNNDGKVERTEVETVAKHRTGNDEDVSIRPQVDEVMTADHNGDGVIEFREARGYNSRLIAGAMTAGRGRELLALDPNKDARLTARELETLARAAFATVDLNGNGVISTDEYLSFDQARRETRK